eukprot:361670-Chlamydomonas_euryale.AAC.4
MDTTRTAAVPTPPSMWSAMTSDCSSSMISTLRSLLTGWSLAALTPRDVASCAAALGTCTAHGALVVSGQQTCSFDVCAQKGPTGAVRVLDMSFKQVPY